MQLPLAPYPFNLFNPFNFTLQMNRLLLLLPVLFCAGCASQYWQNRRADAADVFTATAGIGLGATARIGPLHAGLGVNADLYGIEAGEVGALGDPYHFVDGLGNWAGDSCFVFNGKTLIELGPRSAARGKDVAYRPSCIPFWDPPPPESPNPARWTQIEVAAGLLGGVRLGFNPGELLDFLLGFFGADLYGDDLARGEMENPHAESAELSPHAESAENAEPEPRAESAEFAEH